MAQYSHLPIYNKAYGILREFYVRVPKFGKQYKYFLGNDLIKYAVEIIKIIIGSKSRSNASYNLFGYNNKNALKKVDFYLERFEI